MSTKQICFECGEAFAWDEEEKQIYGIFGFENAPKRCRVCRGSEKALNAAIRPEKEMYTAVCDECGKETQLPFKPKGDKPVYCRACFALRKKNE